jgi:hypothetical protein
MDLSQLVQLGQKFCLEHMNHVAAVLCFDYVSKIFHQAISSGGQHSTANLSAFFNYAQLLKKMALDLNPSKDIAVQELLGVQPLSNNDFLIPIQTELHNLLESSRLLCPFHISNAL